MSWKLVAKRGTRIRIFKTPDHLKPQGASWRNTIANLKTKIQKSGESFANKAKTAFTEKNRNFVMTVMVGLAVIVAVINISEKNKSEVTVHAEDNSVLVSLIYGDGGIETVTNEAPIKKENRISPINVALAAPEEVDTAQTEQSQDGYIPPAASEDNKIALIGEDTLVRTSNVETSVSNKPRTNVIQYTVQSGETITSIAGKFNIDEATILEENKMFADDILKSGQTISILPVSGATERVDQDETLEQIAKKHNVDIDAIIDFNNLDSKDAIEFAQILIIPEGNREVKFKPQPVSSPTVLASATPSSTRASRTTTSSSTATSSAPTAVATETRSGNRFQWGWCTWYVAEKRNVTWRGNAGTWLGGAQSAGRATGKVPAVGSIMVTNESPWGHVAFVEAVNGDTITVSEMNYRGFGVVSKRTLSAKSSRIKGFIY